MLKDFAFWTQIASWFLIRSTRATFVLSLLILSAVSVMIFLSAMAVGVNDAVIRWRKMILIWARLQGMLERV